ncbi:hypothetical protein ABVT39_003899 [Epinephelus coioides]
MDQEDPWVSLLVPVTDRPITPQIDLRRVPMDEDIPWASLLAPLPKLISPLRSPVPPHGSSFGSSTGDSDMSSLLGDTMDEDIPWASLLAPLPKLISPLRSPVPPHGSSFGSSTGDSDTSSLLGDTMDEDIPWASLLVPLPRLISPLRSPVPPHGCDHEVSPSDPPPAPGKSVEAGPSKGRVAPGKPKSLPQGPKPRFGQFFIYSVIQKSTPPNLVVVPCEDLTGTRDAPGTTEQRCTLKYNLSGPVGLNRLPGAY